MRLAIHLRQGTFKVSPTRHGEAWLNVPLGPIYTFVRCHLLFASGPANDGTP